MDISLSMDSHERDLIAACRRKERWAQQRLYEEFYGKMMGVCMRYADSEDEALDFLHEGFMKVFRHIAKYQSGTSLNAWIRRIMVNTCIDAYRKKVRRRTEDIEEAYGVSSNDADAVSQCSEREILEAIQKLSFAYRTVFNLYVIEGYSHKEIAEKLEISESTSRSNLVKARGKLKTLLKTSYAEYGR
ncbi:MAG: RNA polymerase sigma factor [Bacteroidota bacterium]